MGELAASGNGKEGCGPARARRPSLGRGVRDPAAPGPRPGDGQRTACWSAPLWPRHRPGRSGLVPKPHSPRRKKPNPQKVSKPGVWERTSQVPEPPRYSGPGGRSAQASDDQKEVGVPMEPLELRHAAPPPSDRGSVSRSHPRRGMCVSLRDQTGVMGNRSAHRQDRGVPGTPAIGAGAWALGFAP